MYIYSDPIGDHIFRPNIMETKLWRPNIYILRRPNNGDLKLWRLYTYIIET